MDLKRLGEILYETTREYRKGAVVERSAGAVMDVSEVYIMPHVSEAPDTHQLVDCEFLEIGVDKTKAERLKPDLIEVLKGYPEMDRFIGGPSYIEVGGVLGDQSAAFRLFALMKVLGLGDLITPATFGFKGQEARDAAGSGFIMIAPNREVFAR